MKRTTASGLYDHGVVGLLERVTDHQSIPSIHDPRQRFWTVRTKSIILATGALERHVAFGNNDRPGVMSVSAGRTYLNRFGVLSGEKIIVCTNNDSSYLTASELRYLYLIFPRANEKLRSGFDEFRHYLTPIAADRLRVIFLEDFYLFSLEFIK